MKIEISRLSHTGSSTLSEKFTPQALDLGMPNIKFRGALEVNVAAQKSGSTVIVKGDIFLPLTMLCSRCLAEYLYDLKRKVAFDYDINSNDTSIDITEDVRSEIILNYSLNPLCKPDCKGLCLKCGKDLNEGKCGCSKLNS